MDITKEDLTRYLTQNQSGYLSVLYEGVEGGGHLDLVQLPGYRNILRVDWGPDEGIDIADTRNQSRSISTDLLSEGELDLYTQLRILQQKGVDQATLRLTGHYRAKELNLIEDHADRLFHLMNAVLAFPQAPRDLLIDDLSIIQELYEAQDGTYVQALYDLNENTFVMLVGFINQLI